MSHPMNHARQSKVEHSRVAHITRGYKSGGAVHKDAAEDRKLIKSMVKKSDLKAEGDKSAHRMDRPKRARGGKVKKNASTIVNVITGGHPAGGAVPPMPAPPPGLAGAAMAPPPPPMAAKPPMMPPPGAGPGGPPMPMRARGGKVKHRDDGGAVDKYPNRVSGVTDDEIASNASRRPAGEQGGEMKRARGGGVNRGDKVFEEGRRNGTQVSHDKGKGDLDQMNRGRSSSYARGGKVSPSNDDAAFPTRQERKPEVKGGKRLVSFYAGGRVESPQGVAAATKLPGGSGGGEARLAKEHRAERK